MGIIMINASNEAEMDGKPKEECLSAGEILDSIRKALLAICKLAIFGCYR